MNKEEDDEKKPAAVIPSIRSLRIERFRGIERLEWQPAPGLNVIVGPGDTGKSTILEAIALLFSPAPNLGLTEFDYYGRDFSKGFVIEAVLAVGDARILKGDKFPLPPLRGWHNGNVVDLPDENGAEAVLVCRLTATPEFETLYEVIAADGETRSAFSRPLRQRIGIMRLGVSERGERDLRLVQGGALDRFMQGHELRQSILQAILKTPIHDQLGEAPKEALGQIEKRFSEKNLPHPIRLGLVGTPGVSLAASVGLTVGASDESALPLPSWGTGTRRFASLELASILAQSSTLAVVDEPEAGLEPYRQRSFIRELHSDGKRQAFITTHAPAVLSAAAGLDAVAWRINSAGSAVAATKTDAVDAPAEAKSTEEAAAEFSHQLAALATAKAKKFLRTHPEAVLARLPVICEGITEVGFATRLFVERFTDDFSSRGIFAVDAGGHDTALSICKAFIGAGISVAAVVDDEGHSSGGWDFVKGNGVLLRWADGAALEKAIIKALPDAEVPNVPVWAEEASGRDTKHYTAELRTALGIEDKTKTPEQLLADCGREKFVEALLQVVCPPRKGDKKPSGWFKSFDGGFVLASKVLMLKPRPVYGEASAFLDSVEAKTRS